MSPGDRPGLARRPLRQGRPGPVTVAKAYRLLHTVCATAVADELIARNPCTLKGAMNGAAICRTGRRLHPGPAPIGRCRRAPLPGDAPSRRLVRPPSRRGHGPDRRRPRPGGGPGHDRQGRRRAEERRAGDRAAEADAGKRVVAIPHPSSPICEILGAPFAGPAPDGLLVVGTKGQPVRRASFYTAWRRATAACNLCGLRFHDLRHTGATLAAATGAGARELMARFGRCVTGGSAAIPARHRPSGPRRSPRR